MKRENLIINGEWVRERKEWVIKKDEKKMIWEWNEISKRINDDGMRL